MRSFPGEISWWLLRGTPNFYSDPSGVGGFLFSIRKILFRGVGGYALSYLGSHVLNRPFLVTRYGRTPFSGVGEGQLARRDAGKRHPEKGAMRRQQSEQTWQTVKACEPSPIKI